MCLCPSCSVHILFNDVFAGLPGVRGAVYLVMAEVGWSCGGQYPVYGSEDKPRVNVMVSNEEPDKNCEKARVVHVKRRKDPCHG